MNVRSSFLIIAACALSSCATPESATWLEVDCGEIAVVGRVATLHRHSTDNPGFLPNWVSAYDLEIRIKRVLKGKERRRRVRASVEAHAQIRDDRDFLIVMTPDGNGSYILKTAALIKNRPKLVPTCDSRRAVLVRAPEAPYRPMNFGARFSLRDWMPSMWSAVRTETLS